MSTPSTAAAVLLNFFDRVAPLLDTRPFHQSVADAYKVGQFTEEFAAIRTGVLSACSEIELWLDTSMARPAAGKAWVEVVTSVRDTLEPGQMFSSGSAHASAFGASARTALATLDDRLYREGRAYGEEISSLDLVLEAIEDLKDFVDTIEDERANRMLFQLVCCLEFACRNYDSLGPQAVYNYTVSVVGALLPQVAKADRKQKTTLLKVIGVLLAFKGAIAGTNEAIESGIKLLEHVQEGARLASSAVEGERKLLEHSPGDSSASLDDPGSDQP